MKNVKRLLGIISVLVIIFSTGCQDVNIDNDQRGHLVIKLTDAPFPIGMVDAAMVNIVKVEIRKKSEGTELGYPYITLMEDTVEFNLLDLRNGYTAELVDMEIDAGNYDLIRLYVDEVSLTVINGGDYSLKVPSGSQTGIKIFIEPDLHVAGGLTTDVLLDISLEKSFILKGNTKSPDGIKGFNFKPVIRAVNNSTVGMVEGLVTDEASGLLEDATVWLIQDTDTINTAYTVEGYYAMLTTPPGLYTMSAAKVGFDTITVEGVEIVEGNRTEQNFTLPTEEEEE